MTSPEPQTSQKTGPDPHLCVPIERYDNVAFKFGLLHVISISAIDDTFFNQNLDTGVNEEEFILANAQRIVFKILQKKMFCNIGKIPHQADLETFC